MQVTEKVELTGGVLELEVGKLAKQADGACLVRFGETFVLATACFVPPHPGRDFLPLTVDYREYTYAAGGSGGWFKREGRPTEKEILTSRLIDRPLRPLFPTATGSRPRSSPACCRPTASTTRRARHQRRVGRPDALRLRVRHAGRRGARRPGRRRAAGQPDPREAGRGDARDRRRRDRGRGGHGRGERKGVAEARILDAIDFAHAEIRKIIAASAACASRPARRSRRGSGAVAVVARVRAQLRERWAAARRGAAGARQVQPVRRDRCGARPGDRGDPEEQRAEQEPWVKAIFREMVAASSARGARQERAPRRPRLRCYPPGHLRGRHAAARARLGAVHPRRDQALVTCTLAPRGRPDHRGVRGRVVAAFSASLQLPPFSVGESSSCAPGRREIGHGNLARRASPGAADQMTFPTRCAWSATSSSRTARRRWPPSAAAPSP